MGLMGTSITACLLGAGHRVSCVESDPAKLRTAAQRLFRLLRDASKQGLVLDPASLMKRVAISGEFSGLAQAKVVIESTVEDLAIKRRVIQDIEAVVSSKTLIGCNTSAIPVTELQGKAQHPERVLGLHWAEPAHITRFMEIICGKQTAQASVRCAKLLARRWGKEPSLLRRDIRGFITNRIMYAMLR